MTDISQQARFPMMVVLADAANSYCDNRLNHVIMSLVWLVLTNGNIPAIVATLISIQTMKIFQRTGYGESKTFFGGKSNNWYIMGLGQGNRMAPPSWIQLSSVLVNIFKRKGFGAQVEDPITLETIHTMGVLFVDNADLYTGLNGQLESTELWTETQERVDQWSSLLDGTGGALKPEKCFWYSLYYECQVG